MPLDHRALFSRGDRLRSCDLTTPSRALCRAELLPEMVRETGLEPALCPAPKAGGLPFAQLPVIGTGGRVRTHT